MMKPVIRSVSTGVFAFDSLSVFAGRARPPVVDCRQRWVVKLDKLGFSVSTGSACASGKEQPTHVLAAMGYAPDQSDRMLRFSSGWETAEDDWTRLCAAIGQVSSAFRGE